MIKFKVLYSSTKQWLLEYTNPLWNVHNDVPEGKLKRKDWWRTSCWKVRTKK